MVAALVPIPDIRSIGHVRDSARGTETKGAHVPEPDGNVIAITWCGDADVAGAAARLFVEQADPSYISHGELQSGRAVGLATWASDIDERMRAVVRRAAANAGQIGGLHLATMVHHGALVGFALVDFVLDAPQPYAVLEDLLIATAVRGHGLGERFLVWLEGQCRARGVIRLFLESGQANHKAHAFFKRAGFRPTSVTMMRDLEHASAV